MNFDLKKCGDKISTINYSECFFSFLDKKNRWVIFISLFFISVFCVHIWYSYVYHPGWSDEQKKAYMNSKEKGVALDKTKFDSIISQQKKRKDEYGKKVENLEDIFRLGERKIQ
jgi:hypothetical protein